MNTLFPMSGNFRIVRLRETDAFGKSDHLKTFTELVEANETMYPGIHNWLKSKVLPGLKSSQRVAYVGYEGEKPIVSAVVKLGGNAKFCHLRIYEDFQDLDLGQVFFSQMAFEIRRVAKKVHFTLPESLWVKRKEFFNSFGFRAAKKADRQYRKGDTEMICSAPFPAVWSAVLEKLPKLMSKFSVGGYSMNNRLLLSVKPKYAEKVFRGEKIVEIRRVFSEKWIGHRVSLYASRPLSALVGEATVENVFAGRPQQIWLKYGPAIGCLKQEFDGYVGSAEKVFAIELRNVLPYVEAIPLNQVTYLLGKELRPPQSHLTLGNNKTWARAISIAALLHGSFRIRDVPQPDAEESNQCLSSRGNECL